MFDLCRLVSLQLIESFNGQILFRAPKEFTTETTRLSKQTQDVMCTGSVEIHCLKVLGEGDGVVRGQVKLKLYLGERGRDNSKGT